MTRRQTQSKAYTLLAELAARQAGCDRISAETAAEDADALAIRTELWEEYERRLRDDKTYTLDDCRAWLAEQGVEVDRSSVHRNRQAIRAGERALLLAAQRGRQLMEAVDQAGGAEDLFRASRAAAGQIIFDALTQLPTGALEEMSPTQTISLISTLGQLSRDHAQVDLTEARLREAEERFAREMERLQAQAPAELTDDLIADARRSIFGGGS